MSILRIEHLKNGIGGFAVLPLYDGILDAMGKWGEEYKNRLREDVK